jgi:hypothetical protein
MTFQLNKIRWEEIFRIEDEGFYYTLDGIGTGPTPCMNSSDDSGIGRIRLPLDSINSF